MLLTLARREQVHREVYIALLHSVLATKGSKREVAKRAGISPQYLSYLLHAEASDLASARRPNSRVAKRIAAAIPADADVRASVLEHMTLANQRRTERLDAMRTLGAPHAVAEVVAELRAAYAAATYAADSAGARQGYVTLRDVGIAFLDEARPERFPLECIDVALLVHDAQCVLNHPADALFRAKYARAIAESLDSRSPAARDGSRDELYLKAIRAETVAYHNLGLYARGYACTLEAEASPEMRCQRDEYLPHVYRDRIDSLLNMPRFTLTEVAGMATQVLRLCEARGSPLDPLWMLLIARSAGNAYLRYGKLTMAERALREPMGWMRDTPSVGPLHRAMLLKVYAKLLWARGDQDAWRHYTTLAVRTALDAGLSHQIVGLRRAFGPALDPILESGKAVAVAVSKADGAAESRPLGNLGERVGGSNRAGLD